MKKLQTLKIACIFLPFLANSQVVDFATLNAQEGPNKKIEWTTSTWNSGYGHKVYNFDPGGKTLLNIAARHNSSSWTDLMTFTSNGMIGIGTTNPNSKLTITRSIDYISDNTNEVLTLENRHGSVDDVVSMRFNTGGGDSGTFLKHMRQGSEGTDFAIFTSPTLTGTSRERLRVTKDGNIGIGTNSPVHKLNIDGGSISIGPDGGTVMPNLSRESGQGGLNITRVNADGSLNRNLMIIKGGGNIGIGTLDPGDWKLAVNGKIRAKEIKVETGWPDFVFYDDYKLPSLKEVENYIKEKGHLQDIPSAKQVEENGIFLGEMDAKLLQKIEELTLYTIQQEKKINKLEKENEVLKSITSELKLLKSEIKKLKIQKNND